MSYGYSLFKAGRVWHYDFMVGGKRFRRSTRETNRKDADAVASKAYQEAVAAAKAKEPVPTLRKLARQWIRINGAIAAPSYVKHVRSFERHHLYRLADVMINRIRTEDVEKARAKHLRGRSRSTANHWLRILRMLFGWAARRGIIDKQQWRVTMLKVQRTPRPMLPVAKAKEWLDAVDAAAGANVHVGIVIRLILGLGLRIDEAVGARWEWIDWERMIYTPGKTKGREAEPIPIPEWLAEELAPKCFPDGVIALSIRGAKADPRTVRKVMRKANDATGIHGLTPHRLRGTYATLLSAEGVPVQDIQKLLRHKDFRTTMGYLESGLGMSRNAVNRIATKMRIASSRNCHTTPAQPA